MKLVYDYIKFHLGLYLATPPVFAIIAESFDVKPRHPFQIGLALMIAIYVISGIHASWFMGTFINEQWTGDMLTRFDNVAYGWRRRFMHHTLYWAGIVAGFAGLIVAMATK